MIYGNDRHIDRKKIDPNYFLGNEKGPAPKGNKPWHKIVVDVVTALLLIGGFVWFVYSVGM